MPDNPSPLPNRGAGDKACFGDSTTRRVFLAQVAGTGAAVVVGPELARGQAVAQERSPASEAVAPLVEVALKINGKETSLKLDPRVSLLDALREHLHLTGTKKGCDHGQCGACTVLVNGRRINSCLSLAVMHAGDAVTTIEGLGQPGNLHPMQAAFVEHDGYQCGYCTPGQICSAVAVLEEIKAGVPSHATENLLGKMEVSEAEIRERMSGNICRCAAYANIVAAIKEVAEKSPAAV